MSLPVPKRSAASAAMMTPTSASRRPRRAPLVLILGSLTALGPLTIDLYLPALPQVSGDLHVSAAVTQLTLTTFMIGIALGQLVIGPLSDTLGRRRPLLIGLSAYVVAGALCALAPTATVLIGMRLVQGLAGAAGIVIARAVVRDLYDGLGAARLLSSLMLVSGTAPILAPVLGAQLLRLTSWRGVFVALTVLGLVVLAATATLLTETLPAHRRRRGGLSDTLRTMRDLVADSRFTGYLLTGSLGFAALFAYIAGSSFTLQEVYGASPQTYSLLFALNSIGLVVTGQLNGKVLLGRFPSQRVLATGLAVLGAAGIALVLLTTSTHAGLPWIALALFLTACPVGLILPTTTALSLQRAPHAAGSASALLGTTQFLMAAVAPALTGLGGRGTALPMALSVLALALTATLIFLVICRPWRPTPDPLAR
ncbi:multidrug effflux MFS transporter [Streptomyces scabiei]|uniref:multidrug effflux MFS transporter n=1 Tax=Streptomyces scabiei TaxID=1930 RepID=UPI0004E7A73A|nr:multidrug effflux MFS transporter [Streptomyces scabiei]KFG08696.1 MFS transporter [Streptomyces scabiei]MDX2835019.1 multidrug effflux MFS transporter [Streptomyces scabiei]MDX3679957.1 multidrug effflux MFS transporter [Streptomyces scabiei]